MTTPITMPIDIPDTPLATHFAGTELPAALLFDLTESSVPFDTTETARREHGRDWWPLSIGWIVNGEIPSLPGAVVRPRNVDDVVTVLRSATRHRVAVTPQGGRSGVVGGAIPQTGGLALDLTGLRRIVHVDDVSMTVTVEAGCLGPDLENHLNDLGLTVGHFPQSFDLATVGGWLACRGAGQYSNRYGKIEDIVRGLTVVLADGRVITTGGRGPRQAVGPDLTQLFVGSEGTLGVIVSATLACRRLAKFEARAAYSFESFAEGLAACRRILQRGASPAVLRLYDEAETQRNFEISGNALIVIDEGDRRLVEATMKIVDKECRSAKERDKKLVNKWLGHRNDVGALGPLWQRGIVVDTIEIAGPWSTLDTIHDAVTSALRELPETVMASVHQSHAYLDGACLYFTFVGRPTTNPDEYYRRAWDVASTSVLANGGALSHHHGIGRNRARFTRDALGSSFDVLVSLKELFDPHHIMNPGVLALGGDAW